MKNARYKHILWDWNGTLWDDAWLCVEIINQMLHQRGLPAITREQYQELFGFPVIDYYRKLGFDFSTEPFVTISTEFISAYEGRKSECALRYDALELLKSNHQNGVSQSILSASKQIQVEEAVTKLGISDIFTAIMGLDNHHAFGKVDIGKKWISETDLALQEILLIGDTLHDYEVAKAMGIDCYLIPSGHQSQHRLAACGAKVIASFADLRR